MKYCTKCGEELLDDASICPSCGCSVESRSNSSITETAVNEKSTMGILSIVFAFLMPFIGLICAVMGLKTYKTRKYRTYSLIGLIISLLSYVFFIVMLLLYSTEI